MATPWHKNTCPGGHEIYNFGRPFLGHYTYMLSLSNSGAGTLKRQSYMPIKNVIKGRHSKFLILSTMNDEKSSMTYHYS